MNVAELLPTLFINLMSLFRKTTKLTQLTFPQTIALYIIPDQGIEMSVLSKKIGIDLSTLSRLVNGLEKRGFVKRRRTQTTDRLMIRYHLKCATWVYLRPWFLPMVLGPRITQDHFC